MIRTPTILSTQSPRLAAIFATKIRVATFFGLVCWITAWHPSPSHAGISGENIIVVVNRDSLVSRTVANHYVHLRNVPDINVIFLDKIPAGLTIGLNDFKTNILQPVLKTVEQRGLAAQTRCIAYSADFPTAVNIRAHYDRLPNAQAKKYIGSTASITGLTYYYKYILNDLNGYLGFESNLYARGKFDRSFNNPFTDDNQAIFDLAMRRLKEDAPTQDAVTNDAETPAENDAETPAENAQPNQSAGRMFQELFTKFPSLAPLAILSARGFAKAGDRDAATQMIKSAIQSGWWSADYLKEDDLLLPLLDDAEIQRILPALSDAPFHVQGPMSFSSLSGWTPSGYPLRINQGGMPYLMSCSLAVVCRHGNTLHDAVAILRRAATADRTYPDGKFLFAGNSDVRAQTRMPGVGDALLYLESAGFPTDVFRSTLPTQPGDVAGLFVGAATVDLKKTKWKLQPGAIAETLTSTAGVFQNASQTKLTEYLAAGAAMSSGAVVEPYSIQAKFPLAMMHGYYASGLSAVEAYYSSVQSPYQLLIVGDPVCQPFAHPPNETVDISFTLGSPKKIRLDRQAIVPKPPLMTTDAKARPTQKWEIFVEGRLIKAFPATDKVDLNVTGDLSGVVNVCGTLVGFDASQPRRTVRKQLKLPGTLPTAIVLVGKEELDRTQRALDDDGSDAKPITIQLDCQGADKIMVTHQSETVATLDGSSGAVKIETNQLGGGPLRLRPVAVFGKQRIYGLNIAH